MRRDYEALKVRFAELNKLRSTEAEEALEEHKRLSEARDAAAERTIKSLQTENERLKQELVEARKASKIEVVEPAERSDDSHEKIQELQKRKLESFSHHLPI